MDKQLLIDTLSVQTHTRETKRMRKYIKRFCKANDLKCKQDNGNLYVTKGKADIYPCIVAHTDTVHRIKKELNVVEHNGVLLALDKDVQQTGIGGDDKCGIFIALHMLLKYDALKCAFFRDEECGGDGSQLADLKFFDDVSMIIQPDRRGNDEVIQNSGGAILFSKELLHHIEPLMKKHSRELGSGSFTDCNILTDREVGICTMNVGCGYYRAHTSTEVVVVQDVSDTIDFIAELIDITSDKRWLHKDDSYKKVSGFGSGWGGHAYGGYYDTEYDTVQECYYCGGYLATDRELNCGICEDCIDYYSIGHDEVMERCTSRKEYLTEMFGEYDEDGVAEEDDSNEDQESIWEEHARKIDEETDRICGKPSDYLSRYKQKVKRLRL